MGFGPDPVFGWRLYAYRMGGDASLASGQPLNTTYGGIAIYRAVCHDIAVSAHSG